jgi:hypothetical protein
MGKKGILGQPPGFPVFDFQLFTGNRTFAYSSLAALLNYSATFAVTFLLNLYLRISAVLCLSGAYFSWCRGALFRSDIDN